MSEVKVNSALVKAFTDGNFFASGKVGYENAGFVPPTDSPWAQVFFVPTSRYVATLGRHGQDRLDGFLQIDLNYPLNSGTAWIGAKAVAIGNVFTVGARFIYEGQEVIVSSCGRSQGRVVNNFYRVSITVMFYAHITR